MSPIARLPIFVSAVVCLLSTGCFGRPIDQDGRFHWLNTERGDATFDELSPSTVDMVDMSGRANEEYKGPAEADMFHNVPMKVYRSNEFVCWSHDSRFQGESTFGRCNLRKDNKKDVEAYFPWGGKDVSLPATYSLLLAKNVYWASWDYCPGSGPVIIGNIGPVSVRMDLYSKDCKGWTAGKWNLSTREISFGCNGKEVKVSEDKIWYEDAMILCKG